jgi:hypothetical protein
MENNEKVRMVAAWTIEEFKKSIEQADNNSHLILTSDYKLLVINEKDLADIIKNNGPK